MKRFFSAFLALFLGLGMLSFLPACGTAEDSEEDTPAPSTGKTINVYNWGEYISNGVDGTVDVNAEFTKRTGIEAVSYTHLKHLAISRVLSFCDLYITNRKSRQKSEVFLKKAQEIIRNIIKGLAFFSLP